MSAKPFSLRDEMNRLFAIQMGIHAKPGPRMCKARGCQNEAHITDFCRSCDDRTFDERGDDGDSE